MDAEIRATINGYGRLQLAQEAVEVARTTVFDKLAEKYDVQYFAFARRLEPIELKSGGGAVSLEGASGISVSQPNASYLGDAVLGRARQPPHPAPENDDRQHHHWHQNEHNAGQFHAGDPVSYTHLRAHET